MVSVDKTFNGLIIVVPIIIGAFLSGIVYLSEGSAIPLTIFQIALIGGFLLFGLKKIANRDITVEVYGLEIEYILLLAIIFFSLIYSPNRVEGLFYSVRFITILSMTYLIYNSLNKISELKVVIVFIIISACFIALKSINDIYNNPEVIAFNYLNEGKKLMRSSGVENDPNIFAISFSMPFMLILSYLSIVKSKIYKVLLTVSLVIVVAAVLVTYSRSTWIAFFIGSFILLRFNKNYTILIMGSVLVILMIIISENVQSIFMSILQRIKDIFAGSSDDSSNIRIMLFIGAIKMFLDSYMLGVGFQGFSVHFQDYYTKQETIGVYEPHSEYYKILSELGLIGFAIFVLILKNIISLALDNLNICSDSEKIIGIALFCSLVSYLIFFLFYAGMLLNTLFFINVSLLFALNKIVQRNNLNAVIDC